MCGFGGYRLTHANVDKLTHQLPTYPVAAAHSDILATIPFSPDFAASLRVLPEDVRQLREAAGVTNSRSISSSASSTSSRAGLDVVDWYAEGTLDATRADDCNSAVQLGTDWMKTPMMNDPSALLGRVTDIAYESLLEECRCADGRIQADLATVETNGLDSSAELASRLDDVIVTLQSANGTEFHETDFDAISRCKVALENLREACIATMIADTVDVERPDEVPSVEHALINHYVHKLVGLPTYLACLRQLGEAFHDDVDVLAEHLCKACGLAARSWATLSRDIVMYATSNFGSGQNQFAIFDILLGLAS